MQSTNPDSLPPNYGAAIAPNGQVTITAAIAPGSKLTVSYPHDAEAGPSPPDALAAAGLRALTKMSNLAPAAVEGAVVATGLPIPPTPPLAESRSRPYGSTGIGTTPPGYESQPMLDDSGDENVVISSLAKNPKPVPKLTLNLAGKAPLRRSPTLSDLEADADRPSFDHRGRFVPLVTDSDDYDMEVECEAEPIFNLSDLVCEVLEIGLNKKGEDPGYDYAYVIRSKKYESLYQYQLGRWTIDFKYPVMNVPNLVWLPECRSDHHALPETILFQPVEGAEADHVLMPDANGVHTERSKFFWHVYSMDQVFAHFPLDEIHLVSDWMVKLYRGTPGGAPNAEATWGVLKDSIFAGLIAGKLNQNDDNPAQRVLPDGSLSYATIGKRTTRAVTKHWGKEKWMMEAEAICSGKTWSAEWKLGDGKWQKKKVPAPPRKKVKKGKDESVVTTLACRESLD